MKVEIISEVMELEDLEDAPRLRAFYELQRIDPVANAIKQERCRIHNCWLRLAELVGIRDAHMQTDSHCRDRVNIVGTWDVHTAIYRAFTRAKRKAEDTRDLSSVERTDEAYLDWFTNSILYGMKLTTNSKRWAQFLIFQWHINRWLNIHHPDMEDRLERDLQIKWQSKAANEKFIWQKTTNRKEEIKVSSIPCLELVRHDLSYFFVRAYRRMMERMDSELQVPTSYYHSEEYLLEWGATSGQLFTKEGAWIGDMDSVKLLNENDRAIVLKSISRKNENDRPETEAGGAR